MREDRHACRPHRQTTQTDDIKQSRRIQRRVSTFKARPTDADPSLAPPAGAATFRRSTGQGPAQAAAGRWLVAGLMALGLAAAATGIWFQRHQTRRCLAFYGPEAARRITAAPVVELLRVRPGAGPGRLMAAERIDVSRAAGLVHLRRGLVEDANFAWPESPPTAALAVEAWDVALEFADPAGTRTTLVIDLDGRAGSLAVVGNAGRVGLGRLGPGLETWIRSSLAAAEKPR